MLHLRLFGTLEIRGGRDPAPASVLAQPKRAALLAILALSEGRVTRRDKLVGLLWPELTEERARNALSKAIHHLRRALGDGAILSGPGDEVRLGPDAWTCDAWTALDALERGGHAAALESMDAGELLESFHLSDAPEWYPWVEKQRSRFAREARACALTLADQAEARGDSGECVAWLRRALGRAPFDEPVVRRLLAELARVGNRAEAMAEYAAFERRLRESLELEPSAETTALADAIRKDPGELPGDLVLPATALTTLASAQQAPDTPVPAPGPAPGAHSRARSRLAPRLAAGAGLLTLAAAWAFAEGVLPWTAPPRSSRVVVLPFERGDTGAALAEFGRVAADWIAVGLSRTGPVEVVPVRAVARELGDGSESAGQASLALARRMKADYLVTGHFVVVGDSVMVSPWILDAGTGTIVRAPDPVRGSVADPQAILIEVRSRLGGALAALLDSRLAAAATPASRPPTYAAYAEYVAGLEPWRRQDITTAADHFSRAYALDTTFVSVLPWLWESLALAGRSEEAEGIMEALRRRRGELDPYDLAAVDWIEGFLEGDRERSLLAGRRMAELAPTSQDANWAHAWAAVNTNRFAEALDAFTAVESLAGWMDDWPAYLDWPQMAYHLSGDYTGELAFARRFAERYAEEHRPCTYSMVAYAGLGLVDSVTTLLPRCLALAPEGGPRTQVLMVAAGELRAHGFPDEALPLADSAVAITDREVRAAPGVLPWRRNRLNALIEAGRWEQLIRAVEEDAQPQLRLLFRLEALGIARANLGDPEGARAILDRLHEGIESPQDSAPYFLRRAGILAQLGEKDAAIESLQDMLRLGYSAAEQLHGGRRLEPLQGHPPFEALRAPRK